MFKEKYTHTWTRATFVPTIYCKSGEVPENFHIILTLNVCDTLISIKNNIFFYYIYKNTYL